MSLIPLNDASETRYGEIARKMLETNNWITLFHDYGVPFWAKPPLSTWLSAASMHFFGINEFAARLPGFLLSLATLWLIWDLTKKHSGQTVATLASLILMGDLYFFLDAGTVMTDPALVFCTTLALVSLWHAMQGAKVWPYLFFTGLGLGLLAKGPIAIILVAMPVFPWIILHRQWRNVWHNLPWIKGIVIVLAIALPWYILAEMRTPGFLNYFIFGEHIQRFLTPGWSGDKYGFAHQEHKGMIWIFAAIGMFPWCLLGGFWFIVYRKQLPSLLGDNDGWLSYLFLCSIVPVIFFTFSSNIIYTYIFPCVPFFAIFFTEYWVRAGAMLGAKGRILYLSSICGFAFLTATLILNLEPNLGNNQKAVINAWLQQHPLPETKLLYWNYKTEFSAQFYSRGRVASTEDKDELIHLLTSDRVQYLVIDSDRIKELPSTVLSHLTLTNSLKVRDKSLSLFRKS